MSRHGSQFKAIENVATWRFFVVTRLLVLCRDNVVTEVFCVTTETVTTRGHVATGLVLVGDF